MNGSDKFVARMRELDATYGDQEHQRAFVARLDACEANNPCPVVVVTHEHSFACYEKRKP